MRVNKLSEKHDLHMRINGIKVLNYTVQYTVYISIWQTLIVVPQIICNIIARLQ